MRCALWRAASTWRVLLGLAVLFLTMFSVSYNSVLGPPLPPARVFLTVGHHLGLFPTVQTVQPLNISLVTPSTTSEPSTASRTLHATPHGTKFCVFYNYWTPRLDRRLRKEAVTFVVHSSPHFLHLLNHHASSFVLIVFFQSFLRVGSIKRWKLLRWLQVNTWTGPISLAVNVPELVPTSRSSVQTFLVSAPCWPHAAVPSGGPGADRALQRCEAQQSSGNSFVLREGRPLYTAALSGLHSPLPAAPGDAGGREGRPSMFRRGTGRP